jgi:ribonuclease G
MEQGDTMYKQLIINVSDHETRVALLEDGTIVELYVDRGDDSDVAGNIYKGKVLRVLPGMQAAFVDVGLNQAAFIYVDDVYTNDIEEYERLFQIDAEERPAEPESNPQPVRYENRRRYQIEELISYFRGPGGIGPGGQIPHWNQRSTNFVLYFFARPLPGADAQIRSYRHFPPNRG